MNQQTNIRTDVPVSRNQYDLLPMESYPSAHQTAIVMRILLIEDDRDLADVIKRLLIRNGYAVDVTHSAASGADLARLNDYDLLLLDRMLPDNDGIHLCRELRGEGMAVPILILTTLGSPAHAVEGLDSGADDYIAKPFDSGELLARIRVLLRRAAAKPSPLLQVADLIIDPAQHIATRNGERIDLTAKEFSILEYMAMNEGNVLTRGMIAEHVWDMHFDPKSNVIDAYISILRRKIDRGFEPALIHTIKGVGYKISERE